VIFGVLPVPPGEPVSSATHVYENVDAGESVRDDIELYRGHPYGASLSVVLMEHDFGDPDKFRAVVKTAVDEASKGITVAVGAIPAVGPFVALAAGGLLTEYGPKIVDAVNTGLDTQDDHVGSVSFQVTAKNMVTMARAALKDSKGIPYHLESPLITGLGASYKVYVRIQTV
jgi:hypothetical protein